MSEMDFERRAMLYNVGGSRRKEIITEITSSGTGSFIVTGGGRNR